MSRPALVVAQSVRQELHDHLVRINPDKKWDFITEQARLAGILCASVHGVAALLHGDAASGRSTVCVWTRSPG